MILLNIDGAARPVRTEPRSSRATDRALSIRSSASSRVSSITGLSFLRRGRRGGPPGGLSGLVGARACGGGGGGGPPPGISSGLLVGRLQRLADQRPDLLTCDGAGDVAVAQE